MMATPLTKEWQTFTQQDPNLPDLKALQKFVKVRKTMASAAIPFAPNNKFDKAEKVNKPKQNPCPKKNSLRIERTSKTPDKTSSNRIDGCPECGDKHYLFACQQFRDSTVSHRLDVTKDNHLCFNCLSLLIESATVTATSGARESIILFCTKRHQTTRVTPLPINSLLLLNQ